MHTYSTGENTSFHWNWDGSHYVPLVQCLLALAGKGAHDSYSSHMFVSRPGDGYDRGNSGLARRWPCQGFERRARHAREELQRIRHQDGSWSRLEVDQHESIWRFPPWPVCAGEWFQATPKQLHPYETPYISVWARLTPEDLESYGGKFKDCDYCEQMDAYLLAADSPYGCVLTETGCLFYTRYVAKYIPHLLQEPAGIPMDINYIHFMDHPPTYSNLYNDRRVRELFGVPTHPPICSVSVCQRELRYKAPQEPWAPLMSSDVSYISPEERARKRRRWVAQRQIRRDACDREWSFDADRRLVRTVWTPNDRQRDKTDYSSRGRCQRCQRECHRCRPTPYGCIDAVVQDPDWTEYPTIPHNRISSAATILSKGTGKGSTDSVAETEPYQGPVLRSYAPATGEWDETRLDAPPGGGPATVGTDQSEVAGASDAPAGDPAGGPAHFDIADDSPRGSERSLLAASSGASSEPSEGRYEREVDAARRSNMYDTEQNC